MIRMRPVALLSTVLFLAAARPAALDESSCSPIDDLQAGAPVTQNSVTLSWYRPWNWDDDSLTYHGRYSEQDPGSEDPMIGWWSAATPITGLPDPQGELPDDMETAVVTGLLPGRTYYFFLRVEESDGSWNQHPDSTTVSAWATTPPDSVLPGVPLSPSGTPLGPTSIRLGWIASGDDGAVGSAYSYEVKVSTNGNTIDPASWWNAAQPAQGIPPAIPAVSGSPEQMTVTALQGSTTYTFGIRALDDGANPSPIVFASATTNAAPPPAPDDGDSKGSSCGSGGALSSTWLGAILALGLLRRASS